LFGFRKSVGHKIGFGRIQKTPQSFASWRFI
jgi:hypothetical protein